jgi:flagellar FliL protein
MKTSRLIAVVAVAGLLCIGAGGGVMWWVLQRSSPTAGAPAESVVMTDTRAYAYVSLDKVIVMLRNAAGDPVSHYLALDVVFMTPAGSERTTRAHLPLLRSVTVNALSELTMQVASRLTVEELTQQINEAYSRAYANDRGGKPFAEAMISRLIIE